MISPFVHMASLVLLIFLGAWASPGWAQLDTRFEQSSPQMEKHWKEKLQRNPRDDRAHLFLGRYYEFVRRIPESAESYRQATLCNPGWPQAFFYLGKAYRELRRYQDANVALQRAITLKSDYAQAYHYLGLVKIGLGRPEEAAEALLKAYDCNPGRAEIYYNQSPYGVHTELGDSKETTLEVIKHVYPVNQHLARIMYNQWAWNRDAMNEYWEAVSGRQLPADKGYQQPLIPGYLGPDEKGYQSPPDPKPQRQANRPAPEY